MTNTNALYRATLVVIAVGMVASIVAEVVHLRTYVAPSSSSFCAVGKQFDCTTVSLSRWAVVFGVPLPIWGIAAFSAMMIATLRRSGLLLPLAAAAGTASVVLLLLELRVIRRVCFVCEVVHVASWGILALAFALKKDLSKPSARDALATLLPGAALVLAAFALLPRYWTAVSWKDPVDLPHGVDESGRRWIGAQRATVTIHEYLHYGCPHCAVAMGRIRRWLSSRGDRVRVVRHQQPLSLCYHGSETCQFVRIALCAGEQGKFWEADAWLFAHAPGRRSVNLEKIAGDLGLDLGHLTACVVDLRTFEHVDREAAALFQEGRTFTPEYIVDGKVMSLREVERLLEQL